MSTKKKWNILFIKDAKSMFDVNTSKFSLLFNQVDIVVSREEALNFFNKNQYDIVIGDISVEPESVALLKQLKDMQAEQTIFALVASKDRDKLFSIADIGINAFELSLVQFDQALETIAQFNPYE